MEEAEEILKQISQKKKFEKLGKMITMYNADLEMYEQLKREDMEQMKLEDVAAEYKREGIMEGKIVGERLREKRSKLKIATNMLKEGIEIPLIIKMTELTEKQIMSCQN